MTPFTIQSSNLFPKWKGLRIWLLSFRKKAMISQQPQKSDTCPRDLIHQIDSSGIFKNLLFICSLSTFSENVAQ